MTTRERNLKLANMLVKKAFEMVAYLKPRKWFLENSRYGLLRGGIFMQVIPCLDVDYCQFCDWGIKSRPGYGELKIYGI